MILIEDGMMNSLFVIDAHRTDLSYGEGGRDDVLAGQRAGRVQMWPYMYEVVKDALLRLCKLQSPWRFATLMESGIPELAPEGEPALVTQASEANSEYR